MRKLNHTPRSHSRRGQSLVEFALILPILLALAGGATDLARAYQAWLTVESASRNAAEYVATYSTDPVTDPTAAQADARRIVCLESQSIPGFQPGSGPKPAETCTAPSVTTTFTTSTSPAVGGSAKNPVGSARVSVSVQFHTLVPWPFISHDGVTISSSRSYSIVRNRS